MSLNTSFAKNCHSHRDIIVGPNKLHLLSIRNHLKGTKYLRPQTESYKIQNTDPIYPKLVTRFDQNKMFQFSTDGYRVLAIEAVAICEILSNCLLVILLVLNFLHRHCGCSSLFLHLIILKHTAVSGLLCTRDRQVADRPLPDNTKFSQEQKGANGSHKHNKYLIKQCRQKSYNNNMFRPSVGHRQVVYTEEDT